MNRKLLVTLLQKNIEELSMITESFIDLSEYPSSIILLAQRKTQDIQTIIEELAQIKEIPQNQVQVLEPKEKELTNLVTEYTPKEVLLESKKIVIDANNEDNFISTKEPIVELMSDLEIVEKNITKEDLLAQNPVGQSIRSIENNIITTEEPKKNTFTPKIIQPTVSRNELLSKTDNSLSATIANKKITDIKQAISIGDRFRFQKELFSGNGEEMNKTLNYLNQLASFDEVDSFLNSKYNWDKKNEVTEDFYQIIRRRFQ